MKIKIIFLLVLLVSALQLTKIMGQSTNSDLEGSKSVVKVVTEFPAKDEQGRSVTGRGTGTGWCWKESKYLVTALHVVAGIPNNKITVYTDEEKKKSGAKVIAVNKEADIALLQLDQDLGLSPLELQPVDPNSTNHYSIWGFQHGVFQMGDAEVVLSRTRGGHPTLNGLINNNDLKFILETKQKYPLPSVKILRISSTIQPGHSGAPIFASSGKVIGMADGGLYEGVASLNWAIPAVDYVPKLISAPEAPPSNRSITSELKGNTTYVAEDATEEEQNRKMEEEAKANTIINGSQSISKVLTASYQEIMETMAEDDKKEVEDIVEQYNIDMDDKWFDVYEDYATGATISMPEGEAVEIKDGWFFASNTDASLGLLTLPYHFESYKDAQDNMRVILDEFLKDGTWAESTEKPEETADIEYETASYDVTHISNDGKNQILVYHAEVDGTDLLVAILLMDGTKMQEPDYIKQVVHFGVAAQLATFAQN